MKRPAALLSTFLGAAFLAGAPASAQTGPAQNQVVPRTLNSVPASVQRGKEAFSAHMCANCHGARGQGAIGPAIAPPGRTFRDFSQQVRQPAGKMPPFSVQAVPDAQLSDIYVFLQSANPNPSSTLAALPGDAQNGARIYVGDGCYECHGRVGQGSAQTGAPRIAQPEITIDALARYIHAPTGNMPPYTSAVVPDRAIADIYAFLKSLPPSPSAKDIPLLNQ